MDAIGAIVENPKNLEIVPLEAATIPASLPDLALGVINYNYANGAGFTQDDAVALETADSDAAETFVNVIVVNAGNENSEKTQALVKAVQSDTVKNFILDNYNKDKEYFKYMAQVFEKRLTEENAARELAGQDIWREADGTPVSFTRKPKL